MATRKPKSVLDVPVQFGGVSIGEDTGRVAVKIDREQLNIDAADEMFCGRRLTGRIVVVPSGVDPDQQEMFDDNDRHELKSTFDVKRFGASRKEFCAGLTFALSEIDVGELGHFAKRSGRLIVAAVAELPDGKDDVEG